MILHIAQINSFVTITQKNSDSGDFLGVIFSRTHDIYISDLLSLSLSLSATTKSVTEAIRIVGSRNPIYKEGSGVRRWERGVIAAVTAIRICVATVAVAVAGIFISAVSDT